MNLVSFSAPRFWVYLALLVLFALVPPITQWIDNSYYLDIANRLVVLAIAAVSLNLILGYGGMISFGHAAYIGIGAYAVGIPAHYDIDNGFLQFAIAIGASAAFALVSGMICLRTRGVNFIMITMAVSMMVFYGFVSIEEYGGDDGLTIYYRSNFGSLIDLSDDVTLYYLCLASLVVAVFIVYRIINSRFGMVIQGAKGNEARMQSLGFNTYRYKLACYVISASMCGFAGALMGNDTGFISPEMMDWTRSGELIFMVVFGGTGSLGGPVLGAGAFLLLEPVLEGLLNAIKEGAEVYWHIPFGIILICAVLFLRGGLDGLLDWRRKR